MRTLLLIMLCCVTLSGTFAQSAPSKQETIDYIQARVAETNGYKLIWNNGTTEFIHDASVSYSFTSASYENGNYDRRYWYKDNRWNHSFFDFKPEFISSVTEGSSNTAANSSVGFITVKFSNSLVKKKVLDNYHGGSTWIDEYAFYKTMKEDSNVDYIHLPYLKQDPTAFERIKKAIMHLKEFYVKKDPFAN